MFALQRKNAQNIEKYDNRYALWRYTAVSAL